MKIFIDGPRRIRQGLFHVLGILIILLSPVFCGPLSEVKIHKVKPKCETNCDENGVKGNPFELYPGVSSGLGSSSNEPSNEINIFEYKPNEVVLNKIEDQYDIGKYSTICWTQIITTIEYVNGSEPKTINEYAISFETPSDIPDKYLEKTDNDEFYKNTKKSYVVPAQVVKKTDSEIVKQNKNITCASGPLYTRTISQFPNKNQKRLEIKVSPKEKSLAIDCNDTNTSKSPISTRLLPEEIKSSTVESIQTKKDDLETTVNIIKNILNNHTTTESPLDLDNTQPRIDKSDLIDDITKVVIFQTTMQPKIDKKLIENKDFTTTQTPSESEKIINHLTKLLEPTNSSETVLDNDDHLEETDKLIEHLSKIIDDEKAKFMSTSEEPITTKIPLKTTKWIKGTTIVEPRIEKIDTLLPQRRNEQTAPTTTEKTKEHSIEKIVPDKNTDNITKNIKTTKKLLVDTTTEQIVSNKHKDTTKKIVTDKNMEETKSTKKLSLKPITEEVESDEYIDNATEKIINRKLLPQKSTKQPVSHNKNNTDDDDDCEDDVTESLINPVQNKTKQQINELTDKIIKEAKKRDPNSEVLNSLEPIDSNPEKEKLVENITMELLHDLISKNSTDLPQVETKNLTRQMHTTETIDQTHKTVKKKLGEVLEDVLIRTDSPITKSNKKYESLAEDESSQSQEATTIENRRKTEILNITKKDNNVPHLRITDIPEDTIEDIITTLPPTEIKISSSNRRFYNKPESKNETSIQSLKDNNHNNTTPKSVLNDIKNNTTSKILIDKIKNSTTLKDKSKHTTSPNILKNDDEDEDESDTTEISEEILSEIPDDTGYTSEPIKVLRKTQHKIPRNRKKITTTTEKSVTNFNSPLSSESSNSKINTSALDESSEEIIELPANESIIMKKRHKLKNKIKQTSKHQTTTETNEHVITTVKKYKPILEEEELENSQEKPETDKHILSKTEVSTEYDRRILNESSSTTQEDKSLLLKNVSSTTYKTKSSISSMSSSTSSSVLITTKNSVSDNKEILLPEKTKMSTNKERKDEDEIAPRITSITEMPKEDQKLSSSDIFDSNKDEQIQNITDSKLIITTKKPKWNESSNSIKPSNIEITTRKNINDVSVEETEEVTEIITGEETDETIYPKNFAEPKRKSNLITQKPKNITNDQSKEKIEVTEMTERIEANKNKNDKYASQTESRKLLKPKPNMEFTSTKLINDNVNVTENPNKKSSSVSIDNNTHIQREVVTEDINGEDIPTNKTKTKLKNKVNSTQNKSDENDLQKVLTTEIQSPDSSKTNKNRVKKPVSESEEYEDITEIINVSEGTSNKIKQRRKLKTNKTSSTEKNLNTTTTTEKNKNIQSHTTKKINDSEEVEEYTELINETETSTSAGSPKKIKHKKIPKQKKKQKNEIETTTQKHLNTTNSIEKDLEETEEITELINDTVDTTDKTSLKNRKNPKILKHRRKLKHNKENEVTTQKQLSSTNIIDEKQFEKSSVVTLIQNLNNPGLNVNDDSKSKTFTERKNLEDNLESTTQRKNIVTFISNNNEEIIPITEILLKEILNNRKIDDEGITDPPKDYEDEDVPSIATRLDNNEVEGITIIPTNESEEDTDSTILSSNERVVKKKPRNQRRKFRKPKYKSENSETSIRTDKTVEDGTENISIVVITDTEEVGATLKPPMGDDSIATRLDNHEEVGITINPTIEEEQETNEEITTEIPFVISTEKKKKKPRKWRRIHIRRRKPKGGKPVQTQIISEETLEDAEKFTTPHVGLASSTKNIKNLTIDNLPTTLSPKMTTENPNNDMPKRRNYIDNNDSDDNSNNSLPESSNNHEIFSTEVPDIISENYKTSERNDFHDYTTKLPYKLENYGTGQINEETTTLKNKQKSHRKQYKTSLSDQTTELSEKITHRVLEKISEKEDPDRTTDTDTLNTETDDLKTEPPIYFDNPETDRKKLQLEFIKELMRELENDATTLPPKPENSSEQPNLIAKGTRNGKTVCYNVSKLVKKTKCPENTDGLPLIEDIRNKPKTTATPYLLKINKLEKLLDMLCTKKLNKLKEKLRRNKDENDDTKIVKRETREKILDQLKRFKRDLTKMNLDFVFN